MNKLKIAKTLLKVAKELETSSRTAGVNFTLTDETKRYKGHILHRVKYADGKLGGWIESENNLQGDAKVLDEAIVYGNAVVKFSATVKDYAEVYGNAIIMHGSIIQDTAEVCGNAVVDKISTISSWSKILNDVLICYGKIDNATVAKSAKVYNSTIANETIVTDQAFINNSTITNKAKIYGRAKVEQSYVLCKAEISGKVECSKILGDGTIIQGTVKDSTINYPLIVKRGWRAIDYEN